MTRQELQHRLERRREDARADDRQVYDAIARARRAELERCEEGMRRRRRLVWWGLVLVLTLLVLWWRLG